MVPVVPWAHVRVPWYGTIPWSGGYAVPMAQMAHRRHVGANACWPGALSVRKTEISSPLTSVHKSLKADKGQQEIEMAIAPLSDGGLASC